jgi:hypothetical protein
VTPCIFFKKLYTCRVFVKPAGPVIRGSRSGVPSHDCLKCNGGVSRQQSVFERFSETARTKVSLDRGVAAPSLLHQPTLVAPGAAQGVPRLSACGSTPPSTLTGTRRLQYIYLHLDDVEGGAELWLEEVVYDLRMVGLGVVSQSR